MQAGMGGEKLYYSYGLLASRGDGTGGWDARPSGDGHGTPDEGWDCGGGENGNGYPDGSGRGPVSVTGQDEGDGP